MAHVTCRMTAKNRDQLRNPTLGNRGWTTFTFFRLFILANCSSIGSTVLPGLRVVNTDRHTDTQTRGPRYNGYNGPHLRLLMAMRPNMNEWMDIFNGKSTGQEGL